MADYSVSGCIVTHNNIATVKKTIETLFAQTKGVDLLLYVVDNCSTDGTREYLAESMKIYPNLRLIALQTNYGFSWGQNYVLPLLTSKYHLVINPDVVMIEDAVAKMAGYLDDNEDVGLVSPRICFPDGRDQILGKLDPKIKYLVASRLRNEAKPSAALREYAMLDRDMSEPVDIENATGCFMILRTALFRRLGGFDDKFFMYFEDCDLTRKLRRYSRAVYYPYATVCHVWGRASKKSNKLRVVQIKSMLYYFYKWRNSNDKKQRT